jgi:hypothetical protein
MINKKMLHTDIIPCCIRSRIAKANSRLTIVVTSGDAIRNSGWLCDEPSSEAAELQLLVVVQSVSVRHSTRLQASRMWSTASSSLARRSLSC